MFSFISGYWLYVLRVPLFTSLVDTPHSGVTVLVLSLTLYVLSSICLTTPGRIAISSVPHLLCDLTSYAWSPQSESRFGFPLLVHVEPSHQFGWYQSLLVYKSDLWDKIIQHHCPTGSFHCSYKGEVPCIHIRLYQSLFTSRIDINCFRVASRNAVLIGGFGHNERHRVWMAVGEGRVERFPTSICWPILSPIPRRP